VAAVVGGLAAAIIWALSNLSSSRSARLIGAGSALSWVMLVGLVVNLAAVAATPRPSPFGAEILAWMVVAGVGSAFGLLLMLASIEVGKVGLATSVTSTGGAIAAVMSILAGEQLTTTALALLAFVASGVVVVTLTRDPDPVPGERKVRAAALALAAAVFSGATIYATGRISGEVPLAWALLPPRLVGALVIALPLLVLRRLRISRPALPFVLASGLGELAGWCAYALAARESVAVAAVLSSLYAAIASLGAFLLFGERMTRRQVFGIAAIAIGVAFLTATQA
jgi:drug/metabolite transporter (DMT)-like permease